MLSVLTRHIPLDSGQMKRGLPAEGGLPAGAAREVGWLHLLALRRWQCVVAIDALNAERLKVAAALLLIVRGCSGSAVSTSAAC